MVALALRDTVQEFQPPNTMPGVADFYGVTNRSPCGSAPGTRARDRELRDLDRNDANTKWRGARSGIIKKEAGLPWEITGKGTVLVWGVDAWVEVDAVAHFQAVLQNAHFGSGWQYFIKRLMRDYYTQDFGALVEIIGPGDPTGPIQGAPTGIAVLDSLRCFATGNMEYPIIYYGQITGQMHLMHRSRIIRLVDMPDGDERFYGGGECALSRYIATAWREILMTRYIESRLDDKPPPGIMVASNMTDKQRDAAFASFKREQSSDERPTWGNTVWMFGIDPAHPVTLTPITFSQAPEKFDLVTYSNHDVNELALAFNTDKNEIWELAGGNLGSGQQSEIQAQKARGKVIADFTALIERGLNIGILPDGIDFAFKTRDELQDRVQADRDSSYISIAREMHSMSGVFTTQEIRAMLADQSETFQQILTDEQGQVVAPDVNDSQRPVLPEVTAVDDQPVDAPAPQIPGAGAAKAAPAQNTIPERGIYAPGDPRDRDGDDYIFEGRRKDYGSTRAEFVTNLTDLIRGGLQDEVNRRRFGVVMRAQLRRLGQQAYEDGLKAGGIDDPIDEDGQAWVMGWLADQSGYVTKFANGVFRQGLTPAEASSRAEVWANKSLEGPYNAGLRSADKNGLYEFVGEDGDENCATCRRLKGQRHRLRDWDKKKLIPRRDTKSFDCGGWRCQHRLVRVTGKAQGKW